MTATEGRACSRSLASRGSTRSAQWRTVTRSMRLRPFFSYFGSKYRIVPRYPAPLYPTICEPFAGAASYACAYPDRRVVLVDRDPVIVGVWRYLIRTSAAEILALPDILEGMTTDDVRAPEEARALIGFWLNAACTAPRKRPSRWALEAHTGSQLYWGPRVRARLAAQVEHIRHWRAIEGSYEGASGREPATWFVDPPYQWMGKCYVHGSSAIDFAHLARWCREREGQVIVCENEGADWLPFVPFVHAKAVSNRHRRGPAISCEAIWCGADLTLED